MRVEQIRIKNYKVFKDVTVRNLAPVCVFIGKNGVGKSTFFDVFSFLGDALKDNVNVALSKNGRGGFKQVMSRDSEGMIEFEIKFRSDKAKLDSGTKPLATYTLKIGEGKTGRAYVAEERLSYKKASQGRTFHFIDFKNGKGDAIQGEENLKPNEEEIIRITQELESPDILAIKGLGQFKNFPIISDFRELLEGWHISDIHIDHMRQLGDISIAPHLSQTGDNLPQALKYIQDNYKEIYNEINKRMQESIPGIEKIKAAETEDARTLIRIKDKALDKPFLGWASSDGTLKMLAYLVLLNDPKPHPLLCIEEPENYVYRSLLRELADDTKTYAKRGAQLFVSTHSSWFVNEFDLTQVYFIKKENGYSSIQNYKNDSKVKCQIEAGNRLGHMWDTGFFDDKIS